MKNIYIQYIKPNEIIILMFAFCSYCSCRSPPTLFCQNVRPGNMSCFHDCRQLFQEEYSLMDTKSLYLQSDAVSCHKTEHCM